MTDQERMIRRLTLRVGIERYTTSRWRYRGQVRLNFKWATEEEFDAVLEEMLAEGLLIQSAGREGGVKVSVNNGAQPAQEESNE